MSASALLGAALVAGCGAGTKAGAPLKIIHVAFRLDDYSERSPTDLDVRLIRAFEARGFSFTVGVIPYVSLGNVQDPLSARELSPLRDEKAAILRAAADAGIADVALHGYSHHTIRAAGGRSEFAGLDPGAQRQRIAEGKQLLEEVLGKTVTTFIPPWNTYDSTTLKVLEGLGFSTISADTKGEAPESSVLKFLPATAGLDGLRDAIGAARVSTDPEPIVVVLFHHYDFQGYGETAGGVSHEQFLELLDWTAAQPDVHIQSLAQLGVGTEDLGVNRYRENMQVHALVTLTPSWVQMQTPVSRGFYASVDGLGPVRRQALLRLAAFWLFIAVGAGAIALLVGHWLLARWPMGRALLRYGGAGLLLPVLVYTFRDGTLGYHGGVAVAAVLGVCMGSWLVIIGSRARVGRSVDARVGS